MTNQLILTVGLPRSGKTTWAMAQGCPVVNPDAIRWALLGQRFWAPGERRIWAHAWDMARCLFIAGHDRMIIDACNTTKKRRDFWIPDYGDPAQVTWDIDIHIVDTPIEECIRRAKRAEDEEIIPVIERMASEYEEPVEFSNPV